MSLSSLGLPRDGSNLVHWPSMGLRSPGVDQMLVSDGSGRIAVIEPMSSPMQQDDIIIASGPSGFSMNDVIQTGSIVWVAVDEYVDRFDTNSQIWLDPITLPSQTTTLASDNNHVYVGTKEDGVYGLDINNASQIINWNTQTSTGGLNDDLVTSLASDGDWLVVGHPGDGVSVINLANLIVEQNWGVDEGLENELINDVTILSLIHISEPTRRS